MPGESKAAVTRCVVRLDKRLLGYREPVKYVLEEISPRLRCTLVLASDGDAEADVALTPDINVPEGLLFDSRYYAENTPFSVVECRGTLLWVPEGTKPDDQIDHIGAIFRLLSLMDEVGVEERNRLGVFSTSALPESRYKTRMTSLVENHCNMLSRKLGVGTATSESVWPEGRRYCVLLTHDSDAAALGAAGEISANLAKAVLRRDPKRLELATRGLRFRSKRDRDPLFTFPVWQRELSGLGINSSFYLSFVRRRKRDRHDVRSDLLYYPRSQLDTIRQMVDRGTELGLHASINSKSDIDLLLLDKSRIEQMFGVPVHGVRHHYWSIDWLRPYKTYRLHENAGFRYDLSMAWQDSAGLRAGTSFPFRPYDPQRRRPLDTYLIPTAVLDDHVLQVSDGKCVVNQDFFRIKEEVASVGGVFCIDLHSESAGNLYPYEGQAKTLLGEMRRILEEGDAWVTTPWKLVEHWHNRSVRFSERLAVPV